MLSPGTAVRIYDPGSFYDGTTGVVQDHTDPVFVAVRLDDGSVVTVPVWVVEDAR